MLLPLVLALVQAAPAAGPPSDVVTDWADLVRRDARLSFPATARVPASADLDRDGLSSSARAAALLALGSARAPGALSLLARHAYEGPELERRAAIHAIGALGPSQVEPLLDLAQRESGDLRADALLALVLSGSTEGARLARRVAQDPSDPLAQEAGRMVAFAADPLGSQPAESTRRYLELRWAAARRYGLIDGRSWRAWLYEEISVEPGFLEAVALRAGARLRGPAIADLYLEGLIEQGGAERVRGAVSNIPEEVSKLVESGVWQPAAESEWQALFDAVERGHLERDVVGLLDRVRLQPDIGSRASLLLARAGRPEGLPLVELELHSPDPERCARVCSTLGSSRVKRYVLTLESLLDDPRPIVRQAALLAQVQLDYTPAVEELGRRLEDRESDDWSVLVHAMCVAVGDPVVRTRLVELFPSLEGDARLEVATALASAGRIGPPRWVVADALRDGSVPPEQARGMVQSLGRAADDAELALLRDLFPHPTDRELNLDLAVALIDNRDPGSLPILRNALWLTDWQPSLLAAALIADIDGIDSLESELLRPPAGARPEDLRRIGFALGQLGGVEELERLARRNRPNDPALQGATLGALSARTF